MPDPVRFATASDACELASLRWLSRSASERARQSRESFEATFVEWFQQALASGKWRVAVGTSGGAGLAGCMYLNLVEKVPVPGEAHRAWGYITNAFVLEEHRNGGMGAALLAGLIECGRALELELLMVWPSSRAVRFYERAGFLAPEAQCIAFPDDEPSLIFHLSRDVC